MWWGSPDVASPSSTTARVTPRDIHPPVDDENSVRTGTPVAGSVRISPAVAVTPWSVRASSKLWNDPLGSRPALVDLAGGSVAVFENLWLLLGRGVQPARPAWAFTASRPAGVDPQLFGISLGTTLRM